MIVGLCCYCVGVLFVFFFGVSCCWSVFGSIRLVYWVLGILCSYVSSMAC